VQINISARHGQLSEAAQEKIRAKVEKLARIFERMMAIQVVADLQDPDNVGVEITASAEHKHDFVASVTASSVLGATDGASHKIEQQIRRYKERIQGRSRGNNARRQHEPPLGSETEEEIAEEN